MSSREKILNAIAGNKPEALALNLIDPDAVIHYPDLKEQFRNVLQSIGGTVVELNDIQLLQEELNANRNANHFVVNTIPALGDIDSEAFTKTPEQLEQLDIAYIQGSIAVAENGAVWVYEHQMGNRLIPFICQHLILVVEKKNLVSTMHQAYQQIDIAKDGFGAFIAGPSKTADIEQSLVIGAHGARSLVLYLV